MNYWLQRRKNKLLSQISGHVNQVAISGSISGSKRRLLAAIKKLQAGIKPVKTTP